MMCLCYATNYAFFKDKCQNGIFRILIAKLIKEILFFLTPVKVEKMDLAC